MYLQAIAYFSDMMEWTPGGGEVSKRDRGGKDRGFIRAWGRDGETLKGVRIFKKYIYFNLLSFDIDMQVSMKMAFSLSY